jgi:hypothetical protein
MLRGDNHPPQREIPAEQNLPRLAHTRTTITGRRSRIMEIYDVRCAIDVLVRTTELDFTLEGVVINQKHKLENIPCASSSTRRMAVAPAVARPLENIDMCVPEKLVEDNGGPGAGFPQVPARRYRRQGPRELYERHRRPGEVYDTMCLCSKPPRYWICHVRQASLIIGSVSFLS